MSDRPHKIIDRVDTKAAGNAVAVVDEIAVGRERQGRRGDFQPAMLGSTADIGCLAENVDAPVVVLRKALRQHP